MRTVPYAAIYVLFNGTIFKVIKIYQNSLSKPKPRGLTGKNPAELVKNRIFSLCLQTRLLLLSKTEIQRIVQLKPINTDHQPAHEELYILNTQKASTLLITISNSVNWLTFPFCDLSRTILLKLTIYRFKEHKISLQNYSA